MVINSSINMNYMYELLNCLYAIKIILKCNNNFTSKIPDIMYSVYN